jgi:hypothetical protein
LKDLGTTERYRGTTERYLGTIERKLGTAERCLGTIRALRACAVTKGFLGTEGFFGPEQC